MSGIIDMDYHAIDNVSELTVDDVHIDGKIITMTGNPGKTATITAGTGLKIETTDAAAGGANIEILADGAVDITGEGISLNAGNEELTLNSEDGVDIAQANVPTTVKGTLNVVGHVTVNSALDVAGDVTLNSTLAVVGDVTVNSALDVDMAITAPTFIGELNGTINTATTAETQAAGNNSTLIATTAFVASGTATNVSGVVAVANGGTGATTAEVARNNLGLYSGIHTWTNDSLGAITSTNTIDFNGEIDLTPTSVVTAIYRSDPGVNWVKYVLVDHDNEKITIELYADGTVGNTISYIIVN
jgi:hypothetical protein